MGNGGAGVDVVGSNNMTIGGTAAGAGDVISGNGVAGVEITGAVTGANNFANATGNVVIGNLIGTNKNGTSALGNATGILLTSGAIGNTIGGTASAARNVISGNSGDGIDLTGGASGNAIVGNLIGTNAAGTAALGNGGNGVYLNAATHNTIGGSNVLSGNGGYGVDLAGNDTGNVVLGNYVGTDSSGTVAVANHSGGVLIANAVNNTVGGTTAAARNIISGNIGVGLFFDGSAATGNVALGNYIGTDVSGTAKLGNTLDGVNFTAGPVNNTVGGTAPGSGNVVSGNSREGIEVASGSGNAILGNLIGTAANGISAWEIPGMAWHSKAHRRPTPSAVRRLGPAISSPPTAATASRSARRRT